MYFDGLSYRLDPIGEHPTLAADWAELEGRSNCPFFLTWDWIGTWLSITPGLSPLLLSVRDGEVIVAMAILQPAYARRRFRRTRSLFFHQTGDPATDVITIEYNGVLTDRHYHDRVMQSLLPFLNGTSLPGSQFAVWEEIHMAMATDSIARRARDAGLMTLEMAHKPSWFVDLAAVRRGGRPYLETLSSNTRYQIRRAIRIYEEHGALKATAAKSPQDAMRFFEEFKQLHQAYWTGRGQPGGFSNPYFEAFHRALINRCVERGAVELVRIEAGQKLIGQVYNFQYRDRIYAYQTGFAYSDDSRLKPGLVSHYLCLQRHLERGARVYDFMAGDNRYKSNLGRRGPDMMHHVFQRRTVKAQSEAILRSLKNRLTARV